MLSYLNRAEPIAITDVIHEVNVHGFYMVHCTNLVFDARNENELIKRIKVMAIRAKLRVSFNEKGNICIFEAYT